MFKNSRILFIALGLGVGLAVNAATAIAWTGPTASAPNSNIGAPVNVGITAQIKNGDFGANNISAFGNALLSGLGVGAGRYLNFDYTSGGTSGTGSAGYGIRDNAGTLEFKNRSGSWASLQSIIASYSGYWTAGTGGAIYYSGGNVGIGTTGPSAKLDIAATGDGAELLRFSTERQWTFRQTGTGSTAKLDLHSLVDAKNFTITSLSGLRAVEFLTSNTAANNRVYLVPDGGFVGVGMTAPTAALDVNGTVRAATFLYSSDARLKKHITSIDQGIVQLMKLKPISFTWNDKSQQPGKEDIGFIAQEVEKIIPEIVHTDVHGTKSIDYVKLTPILVKALQEQQKDIDALRKEFEAYKAAHP